MREVGKFFITGIWSWRTYIWQSNRKHQFEERTFSNPTRVQGSNCSANREYW